MLTVPPLEYHNWCTVYLKHIKQEGPGLESAIQIEGCSASSDIVQVNGYIASLSLMFWIAAPCYSFNC